MFKVTELKKIADSGPQQYKLTVRDTEDTNPNHEGIIHFGTGSQIRSMLKDGGLNDAEIDVMFEAA
jgi:hypothetical protein